MKHLAILLATYNGEAYLDEQLHSLLNQSYKDYYGTPPCYDNAKYIPKSKVQEKIEDLKDAIQYSANPLAIDNCKYAIEILQELIED